MGASAAIWGPIVGSAVAGGIANMFGGGDPGKLQAYAAGEGDFLDPGRLMEQQIRDRAQMGIIAQQRAASPVTLPGAFAQPLPWYGGAGLPMPVGVTPQDPALFWPGTYQQREGAKFAEPDYSRFAGFAEPDTEGGETFPYRGQWTHDESTADGPGMPYSGQPDLRRQYTSGRWLFGDYGAPARLQAGDPRTDVTSDQYDPAVFTDPETWGSMEQGDTSFRHVQVAGGVPQLRANLELMGVTTDPFTGDYELSPGPSTRGISNQQLFLGARPAGGGKNPRGGVKRQNVPNQPAHHSAEEWST